MTEQKISESVRYLSSFLKDNEDEFLFTELENENDTKGYITIDRSNLEKTIQKFYDTIP